MQVLLFTRKLWRIFGLFNNENDSIFFRIFIIFINIIVIISLTELMSFSLLYFYFYKETDGYKIVYVSLQCSLAISGLLPYIINIRNKSLCAEITKKLQKIVNQRMDFGKNQIYKEAEWKAEMIAKWPTLSYILIYDIGFLALNVFYWIKDLIYGKIDVTKWPDMNILW